MENIIVLWTKDGVITDSLLLLFFVTAEESTSILILNIFLTIMAESLKMSAVC